MGGTPMLLKCDFHEVREVILEFDVRQVDRLPAIRRERRMLLAGVDQRWVRQRLVARRDISGPEHYRRAPRPPRLRSRAADDLAAQIQRMDGQVRAEVR